MRALPEEQLYFLHDIMTMAMFILCCIIVFIGSTIKNNKHKTFISYALISFSLIQEFVDYANRILFDEQYDFTLSTDLPLHFCVIGFYFSIFGIYMAISTKRFNKKGEIVFQETKDENFENHGLNILTYGENPEAIDRR